MRLGIHFLWLFDRRTHCLIITAQACISFKDKPVDNFETSIIIDASKVVEGGSNRLREARRMDKTKSHEIIIPESVQQEAKELVEGAFRLLADQSGRIKEDLAEFNRDRHKIEEKMKDGVRRTTGRIV